MGNNFRMTYTTTADVRTLLERALLNKEVKCFGIDGFGLYGKSDIAQTYPISHITLGWLDLSNDKIGISVHLERYNSTRFGHIMTDKNFAFSFNKSDLKPTKCQTFLNNLIFSSLNISLLK